MAIKREVIHVKKLGKVVVFFEVLVDVGIPLVLCFITVFKNEVIKLEKLANLLIE
jgi:hypothetical protein